MVIGKKLLFMVIARKLLFMVSPHEGLECDSEINLVSRDILANDSSCCYRIRFHFV